MSSLLRYLAAGAAGASMAYTTPPIGWHWIQWFAWVPMLWALHDGEFKRNRRLSVTFGTFGLIFIFYWIANTITLFSNIPWVGAYGVLGLFSVAFGLPYVALWLGVHPLRRRLGDLWMLAMPAWLVVVEYGSQYVTLFPYTQGAVQYQNWPMFQLAAVTGGWGLSFLIMWSNCILGEAIYRRREGARRGFPTRWLTAFVLVSALVSIWGVNRFQGIEAQLRVAPVVRVAQLQSEHDMVYRLGKGARRAFDEWVDQTEQVPRRAADLVVWPEGASPYSLNEGLAALTLWDLAREGDFELVVGGGTRERDADAEMEDGEGRVRIFNSVYSFDRAGFTGSNESIPEMFLALVDNGCDLDDGHVWTRVEARVLAHWPTAMAGGAVPGDLASLYRSDGDWYSENNAAPSPVDSLLQECAAKLVSRNDELRRGLQLPAQFEEDLTTDVAAWRMLRAQTARFPLGFESSSFEPKRTYATWMFREKGCTSTDCPSMTVRCRDTGECHVYGPTPHYDKNVPLPFGEYLPFASTFPWFADLIKGPGDFRAGESAVVFDLDAARVASPICYEGTLPAVCRRFDRPELFVNVTNDAWFGTTSASELHGMLVATRATELGVPMFRSTYSGVSFVTEPHGVIYAKTNLFERVNRIVPIRMITIDTLYGRLGDWFVFVCAFLLAVTWRATGEEAS